MRQILMAATIGIFAFAATPALAGGKGGGLKINLGVATGKGGLVGTLLGSHGRGNNGLVIKAGVKTGKNGLLGALLGGGRGHGHHGCGC